MTWTPNGGFYSVNEFSSASGFTFSNSSIQTVTGGFMSLVPQLDTTVSFVTNWLNPSSWRFENLLNSRAEIASDFAIQTGNAPTPELTGIQRSIFSAGAWNIITPVPQQSGILYPTGDSQYIEMTDESPNMFWSNNIDGGNGVFTIEVDVASFYRQSGQLPLSGFSAGQTGLNELPRLTGQINHGIYFSTESSWDYIEVNPDGIRSINHPEVAIPIDLTTPKRIRIGVSGSDLHLATEDGRAVAAYSMFNTDVEGPNPAKVRFAIGAPDVNNTNYQFGNISRIVGNTQWYNVKIQDSEFYMYQPSGLTQFYSTATATGYTPEFNVGASFTSYSAATVEYRAFDGGTTTVTAQYSGSGTWVDSSSITLSGDGTDAIDLTNIPIRGFPETNQTDLHLYNPIRFKIEQSSNGFTQPPIIDSISLTANKSDNFLNIDPSWKPVNYPVRSKLEIKTGLFASKRPAVEKFSVFYLDPPTGQIITEGNDKSRSIPYTLSGEFRQLGRFNKALSNYTVNVLTGVSGTPAFDLLGPSGVSNLFFNEHLNEGFYEVSGARFSGELASGLQVPPTYTGQAIVTYNGPNSLTSLGSQLESRYQNVAVTANSFAGTHDGTAGIEIEIPSGIAEGDLVFSFNFWSIYGNNYDVYVTGNVANPVNYTIQGTDYQVPGKVSFEATAANTGQVYLGITVASGQASGIPVEFNIDNISCRSVNKSYILATGVQSFTHSTGYIDHGVVFGNATPGKAATVLQSEIYLESYPTGQGIIYEKKDPATDRGISLTIDNNGIVSAEVDMYSDRTTDFFSTDISSSYIGKVYLTGDRPLPLNQWLNLGFIHQSINLDRGQFADYDTNLFVVNFSTSNHLYMTMDDQIIGREDVMKRWRHFENATADIGPFGTYIIDTSGDITSMSGFFGNLGYLHYYRPVHAEVEADLIIKGHRNTPYFVPDVFHKPYTGNSNSLINPLILEPDQGHDVYFGSLYNFYGPNYTYWDHGPWKNHLQYSGNVTKVIGDSPYSGYGSTRFRSDGYGVVPYNSNHDRFINDSNLFGFTKAVQATNSIASNNQLQLWGWVKPHSTGELFSIVKDNNNLTGDRIAIELTSGYMVDAVRYLDDGSTPWHLTGSSMNALTSGEWGWIAIRMLGDEAGVTGDFQIAISDLANNQDIGIFESGLDYGFSYFGKSGDSVESNCIFARTADVQVCDWALMPYSSQATRFYSTNGVSFATGKKGGSFQEVIDGLQVYSRGETTFEDLNEGYINLPISTQASTNNFWVLGHEGAYSNARFNGGIPLFDDEVFREVPGYSLQYNTSLVDGNFGTTTSPIRIGYNVPPNGVNLSLVSNVTFSVPGSISTIDLSDKNPNNLVSFRNDLTTTKQSAIVSASEASGQFRGINSSQYAGRADILFSGEATSDQLEVTSLSTKQSQAPVEGFYAYLIGRGERGVFVSDAFPHEDELLASTTGDALNNYVSNLEKIRERIYFTDTRGNDISNSINYDIYYTKYTPDDLRQAVTVQSGINVDGIGATGNTLSGSLPDRVFSVFVVTDRRNIRAQDSVWINYPSYDYTTEQIDQTETEIMNVIPIMRQRQPWEQKVAGQFETKLNNKSLYDLTIYGVSSGVTGEF